MSVTAPVAVAHVCLASGCPSLLAAQREHARACAKERANPQPRPNPRTKHWWSIPELGEERPAMIALAPRRIALRQRAQVRLAQLVCLPLRAGRLRRQRPCLCVSHSLSSVVPALAPARAPANTTHPLADIRARMRTITERHTNTHTHTQHIQVCVMCMCVCVCVRARVCVCACVCAPASRVHLHVP